jgi:hypothetical protein
VKRLTFVGAVKDLPARTCGRGVQEVVHIVRERLMAAVRAFELHGVGQQIVRPSPGLDQVQPGDDLHVGLRQIDPFHDFGEAQVGVVDPADIRCEHVRIGCALIEFARFVEDPRRRDVPVRHVNECRSAVACGRNAGVVPTGWGRRRKLPRGRAGHVCPASAFKFCGDHDPIDVHCVHGFGRYRSRCCGFDDTPGQLAHGAQV